MSLPPRSLLWRTFLLVSLVMLLSVLAWFYIFRAYEREPRARQLAQLATSVVNLTRAALVSAQPEKRRDLLFELSDREGIRVYPAEDGDDVRALPERPLMDLLAGEIHRRLGPATRLAAEVNGIEAFWISFSIDDDDYWVMLPGERLERQFPAHWVGWGAAALLLALLAAYLIVSRVTRPLRELSRAANAVGRGETPEPLPEAGPEELAGVARAFNQMARDLQQLDADRSLILAGVSHDLRTPLARLRLGIEMTETDEASREALVADIDEMDRSIGQFLDFARESGGEAAAVCDLDALVAEVAAAYRKRGARVDFQPGGVAPMALRARALRRALANLVENALRYAGADAPVDLRTRSAGARVLLEVMDRGPGIPAGETERLKRPFTRLDASRTGPGSTGLGLAIVDRIARAHGGTLDLEPRPGGGLVARLTLAKGD